LEWAVKTGENVKIVLEEILKLKKHPEQSIKIFYGIMNLSKKFGDARLNIACAKIIFFQNYSYKTLKNILENGYDTLSDEQSESIIQLPEHSNIRGQNYYDEGGESI